MKPKYKLNQPLFGVSANHDRIINVGSVTAIKIEADDVYYLVGNSIEAEEWVNEGSLYPTPSKASEIIKEEINSEYQKSLAALEESIKKLTASMNKLTKEVIENENH